MTNDFLNLGLNLAIPRCAEAGATEVENQNIEGNNNVSYSHKERMTNTGNQTRDETICLDDPLVSGSNKTATCSDFFGMDRSQADANSLKQEDGCAMYGISLTVDSPIDYYEFDSLDLAEVFSNFGSCIAVEVSTDGKSATAIFSSYQAVLKAVTALSGLYVPVLNAPLSIRAFRLPENVSPESVISSEPIPIVPTSSNLPVTVNEQAYSHFLIENEQDTATGNLPPYLSNVSADAFCQDNDRLDHRYNKTYRQEMDNLSIPATAPVSPLAYQANVDCYMSQNVYGKGCVDTSDRLLPKHRGTSLSRGNYERNCDGVRKWTARYEIQIDADQHFQVTRRIIGNRGANMKKIFKLTGSKLRLRGRGSGYLEGVNQQEADDPLHLCISSKTETHYLATRKLVESLLLQVYEEYDHYRQTVLNAAPASLTIKFKETFLPARQQN